MDFSDSLERSTAERIYHYLSRGGVSLQCSCKEVKEAAAEYCNRFEHCSDCPSGDNGSAACMIGNIVNCGSDEEVFGAVAMFIKDKRTEEGF